MKSPGFYILAVILIFHSCGSRYNGRFTVLKGKTMGSYYEIAYDSSVNIQEKIDYTLGFFSYLLSTYDTQSIISKFNGNKMLGEDDFLSYGKSIDIFLRLDTLSRKIHAETNGAFNPGLAALYNYWGFGENRKSPEKVDSTVVDSLRKLDFGYLVRFSNRLPLKPDPRQSLNFNAIAAGLAVDLIAGLFDSVYGFKNYYINISGEIRAKGNNGKDSYWPIRIENPTLKPSKQKEFCTIPLKNYALATSGNYRQFFFRNGKRHGHSIDPVSGYPARNRMLSATILAPGSAEADAYATACMVMGIEKSVEFLSARPELKALLLFEEGDEVGYWASPTLSFQPGKENR